MLPFGRGHCECAAPTVAPRLSSLTGSAAPATWRVGVRPLVSIGKLLPVSTRRDLDRVAAVRQLDRRGSFVGFERRFPPPWTTEETDGFFIVKDRNGQK